MFTIEERDRVRDRVLELARADPRVVAGAAIGSLAMGGGDRWSDLDLGFGLAPDTSVDDVLNEWTRALEGELDAVHLFDLPFRSTIYRVLLLPRLLQLDLSFTPAAEFGALGPKFRLLFGEAVEKPQVPAPSPRYLFGLAVHHAVRARFAIERGRWWLAEYWISAVRDQGLALACLEHGLESSYGRGYDDLPADTKALFSGALVRSLDREELSRALGHAIERLLAASRGLEEIVERVEPRLRALTSMEWPQVEWDRI